MLILKTTSISWHISLQYTVLDLKVKKVAKIKKKFFLFNFLFPSKQIFLICLRYLSAHLTGNCLKICSKTFPLALYDTLSNMWQKTLGKLSQLFKGNTNNNNNNTCSPWGLSCPPGLSPQRKSLLSRRWGMFRQKIGP